MLTSWLQGRAFAFVTLAYSLVFAISLEDQFVLTLASNFNATPDATSGAPRAHAWWLGTGPVRASAVRVRVGGSYGRQKHPVLDLWWVTIADGAVHVWAPDIISLRAIEASGRQLWGESLRVNSNVPKSVRIIVHPEAIGSSAWRAHGCDAQLYGSSALFFVKFWFANNMYHLVNDASMVLWHRASTPAAPSSLGSRSSKRLKDNNDDEEVRREGQAHWKQRLAAVTAEMTAAAAEGGVDALLEASPSSTSGSPSSPSSSDNIDNIALGQWRGEPGLKPHLLFYGTLHGALPWARQVFFHSSAYPRGLDSAGALNLGQQHRQRRERRRRRRGRLEQQEEEEEGREEGEHEQEHQQQRSLRTSSTGGLSRHKHRRNKRNSMDDLLSMEVNNETEVSSTTDFQQQQQQQWLAASSNNKPVCVGSLHWGSPLRPISAPLIDRRERAAAAAAVQAQVARACAVTDNALDHSERQRKKHRKKNARRTRRSRHDANNEDEWSGLKKVVWVARPGKRDVGATPRSQAVLRSFTTHSLEHLNSTLRNATKGRVMLEPCCQFSKQSPCEMAAIFREANIVIGMHGAGLANAIMAKPKHAVLVELRSSFGAELDIFAMQSHAIGSGYLWASVAPPQKSQAGTSLSMEQARAVMRCALALWKHPRLSSSSGNYTSASSSTSSLAMDSVDRALAEACSSAVPIPRGQKPPPGIWGYTPVGTGGPDDDDDVIVDKNGISSNEDNVDNTIGSIGSESTNGLGSKIGGYAVRKEGVWSSKNISRGISRLGMIGSGSGFGDYAGGSKSSGRSISDSTRHANHSAVSMDSSNDRARDSCFVRRRKPPCYPGLRTAHTFT